MNKRVKQTIALLVFINGISFSHDIDQLLAQATHWYKEKQPLKSLRFLQEAYAYKPNDYSVLLQLATTYYVLHKYDQATRYYEELLKLNPGNINCRYNCATAYCKVGKFDKAQDHYEQALKRCADDSVKGSLFKLYLRNRHWKKAAEISPSSLWWYDDNIVGKTILLNIDQPGNGLGDGIQFMRYAQILSQAGAQVIVKAHKALAPLLSHTSYISKIIVNGDPIPSHDRSYNICIASLLMTMKHRAIPPSQAQYLWADRALISLWHEALADNRKLKIGLCWLTNFVQELYSGKIVPSPRSVPLDAFAALALIPSISFYSLQKTDGPVKAPFPLYQFQSDFDETHGRFMDTAAVMMNMDLIITVDTSIAHLAAALGKPVWILLPCESDYRWGTTENTVPFYPTARLFRQKNYGSWDSVIQEVIDALQDPLLQKFKK
jgi:tetratricopeptide (TPR) repeat protein